MSLRQQKLIRIFQQQKQAKMVSYKQNFTKGSDAEISNIESKNPRHSKNWQVATYFSLGRTSRWPD